MAELPRAWLTRSGKFGERDDWALSGSVTPGGYGEVGDLSACRSPADVKAVVAAAYVSATPGAVGNFSAQLWALAARMQVGDLVVLPLKSSSQVAIGEITGDYRYDASESDASRRHVRPVQWLRTDIARSAIKQDLLHSLGAFSTYCQISRNEAAVRLRAIAHDGSDPGTKIAVSYGRHPTAKKGSAVVLSDEADVPDADDSPVDLESQATDRIIKIVQEEFSGHRMAVLIEELLTAEGYTCWRAPEGTDGGIDLLAGSGPLGLDAPHLVVQVKSEQTPVGDPVVSQLLGTTTKHGPAAQGLLVAWGGLTQQARRSARDNYFRLRVWEARHVIERVTRHYSALPEEIRTDLPLKQIWVTVEDDGNG